MKPFNSDDPQSDDIFDSIPKNDEASITELAKEISFNPKNDKMPVTFESHKVQSRSDTPKRSQEEEKQDLPAYYCQMNEEDRISFLEWHKQRKEKKKEI